MWEKYKGNENIKIHENIIIRRSLFIRSKHIDINTIISATVRKKKKKAHVAFLHIFFTCTLLRIFVTMFFRLSYITSARILGPYKTDVSS